MVGQRLERAATRTNRLSTLCANERAVAEGERCIQENMAVSFLSADPESDVYERRRAAKVLEWCKEGRFDLILDVHSGPYDNIYCGISTRTSRDAIRAGQLLGYDNFVVSKDGLPSVFDNALVVEVPGCAYEEGYNDPTKEWSRRITELTSYDDLDHLAEDFMLCNSPEARVWAYRNALLLPAGADAEELLASSIADGPFMPIRRREAEMLGLETDVRNKENSIYAINVGSAFLGSGLLGEYVHYVGDPDSMWRARAERVMVDEPNWALLNAAESVLAP